MTRRRARREGRGGAPSDGPERAIPELGGCLAMMVQRPRVPCLVWRRLRFWVMTQCGRAIDGPGDMVWRRGFLGVALVLLALAPPGRPARAADARDVFTVAAVPVDATAANASAARDAARSDGERRAYTMLLDRLTLRRRPWPPADGQRRAAQRSDQRLRGREGAQLRRALPRRLHLPFPRRRACAGCCARRRSRSPRRRASRSSCSR